LDYSNALTAYDCTDYEFCYKLCNLGLINLNKAGIKEGEVLAKFQTLKSEAKRMYTLEETN
jgi:hypothetical protein